MWIVIVLLVIALCVAVFLWQREIYSHKESLHILEGQLDKAYQHIFEQREDLAQKDLDYQALDQGMDEQADAYEQDFLTLRENIEALETGNVVLRNHVNKHYAFCLPDFLDMVDYNMMSPDLYAETPIFDELVLQGV